MSEEIKDYIKEAKHYVFIIHPETSANIGRKLSHDKTLSWY